MLFHGGILVSIKQWIQYAILAMVQSIRKDSIKQGTGQRSIISQNKGNMHRWERIEKARYRSQHRWHVQKNVCTRSDRLEENA